jgi:hypothetical protein
MCLNFDRALAGNDGKGQVELTLGIDAGWQAIELEVELGPASGRAL